MSCTKIIQAVTPVVVVFNDAYFETPNATTSRLLVNVTVSGAPAAGITLNYLVDNVADQDVGIQNGTWELRPSSSYYPTNSQHSVTIQEAQAC